MYMLFCRLLVAVWRERMKEKIVLSARSVDDTLHEATDIDRDQVHPLNHGM